MGTRDSEVCLRIEDTEFDDDCRMNGSKFSSGKFAGSLRRRLMREHLGKVNPSVLFKKCLSKTFEIGIPKVY